MSRLERARGSVPARALFEGRQPGGACDTADPFTPLHELEVRNAFELLAGRNPITREECWAIQAQLDRDLESQRLAQVPLDLDGVFAKRLVRERHMFGFDTSCITSCASSSKIGLE